MNQDKLKLLQAQVRIGGKGTARRKKKVVHRTLATDDKKLQSSLKKLSVTSIPGIEEVNMFKNDGNVIHFTNPKVQASLASNTFAVTGLGENKELSMLMPGIWNELEPESLKLLAAQIQASHQLGATLEEQDEMPELVGNFDDDLNPQQQQQQQPLVEE